MKKVLLGDIIELAYGKSLSQRSRVPGRFPVFGSNGQVDTHNKYLVGGPGIIIGRKGSVGEVIWSKQDFWPIDTTYYVKLKNPDDDLRYWYYVLKTLGLNKLNSHSAIPGLNRDVAYIKQVPLRSTLEQEKIANILGSLDEKIELNRRMNETLEQLGQALFRHYFVDNPEMKSWDKKPLDEIANFLNGLAMQKYPKINGQRTLPVIKIREMSSGITDSTDIASANIPEEYIVHDGDLLFSWSGTLLVKFWSGGDGALNQHLFKVTSDKYPEWLYYYWTKYYLDQFISIAKSKATTMGHIQRKHLKQAEVIIPPNIEEMTSEFTSIIGQIKTNLFETNSLVNIRDSLLPKLISGEIET